MPRPEEGTFVLELHAILQVVPNFCGHRLETLNLFLDDSLLLLFQVLQVPSHRSLRFALFRLLQQVVPAVQVLQVLKAAHGGREGLQHVVVHLEPGQGD